MDYTVQNFSFKLKKTIRYLKLYGVGRTIVKIMGQYHMKKEYAVLPANHVTTIPKQHVGIIGCGNFSFSNIAFYLKKNYGNVIKAAMDVNVHRAASLFEKYNAAYFTTNAEEVFTDKTIDLIYVASNHASHAPYAIRALEEGKSVHIEKPNAVNIEQLVNLCNAMQSSKGKVRLGFNRPESKLGKIIIGALNNETGAAMLNWFVAGHEIEKEHWYFASDEGGRILGNLCHWTDLIYRMTPEEKYPIKIIPSRAEKSDCDISVSMIFGDGTIATINFSAKGHTFEGVRETLNAHKGNTLIELKDFQYLRIDTVEKVRKYNLFHRDHGHEIAVKKSYEMHMLDDNAADVSYVWNTGYLVLKIKEALEKNEKVIVESFEKSFPQERVNTK